MALRQPSRGVPKPVPFDNPPAADKTYPSHADRSDQAQAHAQAPMPLPCEPWTVEATVSEFIGVLQHRFPERFAYRPAALKKRVVALIKTRMPPVRRKGGRPQQPYITRANELYQSQQRDVAAGRREGVNGVAIAVEVMPGFAAVKYPYKRTIMLHRVRGAVYARLRRLRARK